MEKETLQSQRDGTGPISGTTGKSGCKQAWHAPRLRTINISDSAGHTGDGKSGPRNDGHNPNNNANS